MGKAMLRRVFGWIARTLLRVAAGRPADFVIGGDERPYLRRWWLIPRNKLFNVYLHEFLRSDDDRALHDHPWPNLSVLLRGRYVEHTIAAGGVAYRVERQAGAVKLRLPRQAHRIEIAEGETCWTVFVTGPRLREWGFHCPGGWRPWSPAPRTATCWCRA